MDILFSLLAVLAILAGIAAGWRYLLPRALQHFPGGGKGWSSLASAYAATAKPRGEV